MLDCRIPFCAMQKDQASPYSESTWRSFLGALIVSALATSAVLYLVVLIVDPYDSLPFSPRWERYPVTSQSRPYNIKLARRGPFDSAVIGNSTSMLLHPSELAQHFGGTFVSLAMVAASPYEQLRMLDLFNRWHPDTRTLIVGLDPFWCAPDGSPRQLPPMVGFPLWEWLYDENPWNNLPPFNEKTLQHTRSQLRALLGLRIRYPLRPDGYRDFTLTYRTDRDLETVRRRIYGEKPWPLTRTHEGVPAEFPELDALAQELARFPAETLKVAHFIPFHAHQLPEAGSEQEALWNACKSKAAHVLGAVPNAVVLDFMIRSPLTTKDHNYVDAQHYTTEVATELAALLHQGALGDKRDTDLFKVLARPGAAGVSAPVSKSPSG
jgi:hypothetical protein